ncbi:FAD-dependent monooxygenase [Nocardia sp. NPDC052112]
MADRYRAGRILLAGDAAHLFPATGVAINAGMLDTVDSESTDTAPAISH